MNTNVAVLLMLLRVGAAPTEQILDAKRVARGKELFAQYCVSCHGIDGKGGGPTVPALKIAPPDLTRLSRDGKFDRAYEATWIDGTRAVAAHGTNEMPVWGRFFGKAAERGGESGTNNDIQSLVTYLESIQAPTRAAKAQSMPASQPSRLIAPCPVCESSGFGIGWRPTMGCPRQS